jgi:Ca-activated chloride channel homolog
MHRQWALLLALSFGLSGCAPAVARHNAQGNTHFGEQAYTEALTDYQRAQVDEPDRAEPYYNAANASNRLEDLESVIAQTDQVTRRGEPELAADAWYNLGNAYYDAERWLDAIGAYQETLRLRSGDRQAKHNLELALQRLEQAEQEKEQEQDKEGDSETDDEEHQSGSESEQEQSSEGDTDEPSDQPKGTDGSESDPQKPNESPPQQQSQQPSEQPMTPEQAQQLLQAILGDAETLQERLQSMNPAPSGDIIHDW